MKSERLSELELIVELTASRLDLKFTKEINELRLDLDKKFDTKIQNCQQQQRQRRRWNIGTWISIIGPVVAIASAIAAYMRI
jgi:Leu/Phe-tRNA-protein transferase